MSIYAIKLKNWHPIHTKRIDAFKSTLTGKRFISIKLIGYWHLNIEI